MYFSPPPYSSLSLSSWHQNRFRSVIFGLLIVVCTVLKMPAQCFCILLLHQKEDELKTKQKKTDRQLFDMQEPAVFLTVKPPTTWNNWCQGVLVKWFSSFWYGIQPPKRISVPPTVQCLNASSVVLPMPEAPGWAASSLWQQDSRVVCRWKGACAQVWIIKVL